MDTFFELIGFILTLSEYLGIVNLVGGMIIAFGLSQDYSVSASCKYYLGGGLVLIVGGLFLGNLTSGGLAEAVRLRGSAGQIVGLGAGFLSGSIIGLLLKPLLRKLWSNGKNSE